MKELKAMMRVTVAGRKETFVVLLASDTTYFHVLNETTGNSELINANTVEKVLNSDVRTPTIPLDIVNQYLKNVRYNPNEDTESSLAYHLLHDSLTLDKVSVIREFFHDVIDNTVLLDVGQTLPKTKRTRSK
jgi:hypothetical protein